MSRCRERQRRDEAPAHVVHALPDARAGERVPLQPLPDAPATHRDRAQPVPVGAPDQDLVPEPAHEVEEGAQDRHDEHDAAPPHDAPPPPPPTAPPPSDHGRFDRRSQDIASAGRALPGERGGARRLLPIRILNLILINKKPTITTAAAVVAATTDVVKQDVP